MTTSWSVEVGVMPTLYITEPRAVLRHHCGRLLVESGGRTILCVLASDVDAVLVFGGAQITTAALSALFARGADVAFLSSSGRFKGRLAPASCRNIARRRRQFERAHEPAFALEFARRVVRAKVLNGATLLRRLARNGHAASFRASADVLRQSGKRAAKCSDAATLRGIEGAAASAYFAALREIVPDQWNFARRARRPSPDGFNSLLNLGYTLAGNEIMAALGACSLNAGCGFYHVEGANRPSLALDVLEEFRAPLVDRWALSLVNLGIVHTRDFELVRGDCRLRPDAFKRALKAWDATLNAPFKDGRDGQTVSFRTLFLLQSRRLARLIEDGEAYIPFRHR